MMATYARPLLLASLLYPHPGPSPGDYLHALGADGRVGASQGRAGLLGGKLGARLGF